MKNYFDNRKKQKLYQQWVDKSGLPQDSVPKDLEQEDDLNEPVNESGALRKIGLQSVLTFQLTMRHLLYLILIIVVLLISTVCLATVLVMRS